LGVDLRFTPSFNGWGVTAFDALDTMLIMDLRDEYKRALEIVRKADFTKSQVSP
jgi:mannosyl-oligosaccharide alpha-1,2-mannosidase